MDILKEAAPINLDGVDKDDLLAFARQYSAPQQGYTHILFPDQHTGFGPPTGVAHDLARYASNKARAMELRAAGDIQTAGIYERICERIYSNLPDYARW